MTAVNKVIFGDQVVLDLTGDTVTPGTLASGETAHDASGTLIIGTATDLGGGESTPSGLTYCNKVIFGDQVLLDLTEDTVTPETLAYGIKAHNAAGAPIVGVAGREVSIPTMTSNTSPSGVASCSSIYNGNTNYDAWKAFDKNSSTRWTSRNYSADNSRWVMYDFGFYVQPTSIYVHNYVSQNAWKFVIEASVFASLENSWVTLVDCRNNTSTVNTTYPITTNSKYRYFRYRCVNGDNTYRAGVFEFNVFGYRFDPEGAVNPNN